MMTKWLVARNFVFRNQRDCAIYVAKTKALINFAVTAKLICVFVFAYAKIPFSHDVANMVLFACCFVKKVCKERELKRPEPKSSPKNQNGKYVVGGGVVVISRQCVVCVCVCVVSSVSQSLSVSQSVSV